MENYLNLEKLSNDLKNLFQNQNQNQYQNQNQNQKEEESYFDFEIICEQNEISFKTHKSILSSRSHYFKSLFNSKMKEYQENKLILEDVSSEILFSILNYFYSGKIEINLENAIQILVFSSKYLIDELIEICLKFIKNNFQIETIVDVLKLSESMNLNQLLDYSYQFILENFDKFIKTPFFLELEENHLNLILSNYEISLNESEILQSIIKWGKHKVNYFQDIDEEQNKKEQLQNQISNIIQKIRFIDFTKQEVEDILKQDLIPNQISQKLIQFQKLQKKTGTKLNQFIQKENQNENSLFFKSRNRILIQSSIIQQIEYVHKLQEWINDDDFFSKMKKGFSAKRDGFDCKNWHSAVDGKGKTLIIIKTTDNFIFGGFTQVGWSDVLGGWINDPNAFIFSLRNEKDDRKPVKIPIKKESHFFALRYGYSVYGPFFGGSFDPFKMQDLIVDSNLQGGLSNLGVAYQLPDGIKLGSVKAKTFLAGSFNEWEVEEIESFFL
ncbi:pep-cterm sorting domain-containing protein [Anaeramoeba ignava]|uniref:Pep-cterm sorting domain-containing protein n=1 Tax=Anaeramoeba ignava TaxID=1746090 RepID=A0A9Q0LBG1_ANAIG|nr:pep-cterm sorting domain-containing protein [Anaeramoeba ignava]